MSQSERRLAAIMFTDMVGYTALGQKNESLSLALVEEQRKLIRPILARHSGREIKTMGDAFLLEFPSALDAVRCAYDIQRATREFNITLPSEKRVHLRVGVHLGDVVESQGDISGDAVNVASRIEPLAEDGGVCLTQQVYDHVQNKFEVPLVSKGKMSLKNVSAPVEVYRMVMPWDEEKATPPPQLDKNRIAVLPFANISPDPNDEYLADGMTEELITAMSQLRGLQVIARTSVMNYKGEKTKLSTIGNDLRVGTVLEGSVRKAGNRVRVTAQLIDVPTESHVWSDMYDRELDDIFAIQSDIAGKIAQALRVKLASAEPARKRAEGIEAYTLYLKGRFYWNKRDKEGVLGSVKLFQEAIKIDPDYARAYSGLADAYNIAAGNNYMDLADGLARSKEAAMKALELDDNLAEAHASLGLSLLDDLMYEDALREFRRAIELNPSYASAHHWYGLCLQDLGRAEEATKEIETAHALDPLSPVIAFNVAAARFYAGRMDEALALSDKLIEDEPTFAFGYFGRAYCYMKKGMKEKAYADLEAWHRLYRDEDEYKLYTVVLGGWFGEREKALPVIEELIPNAGKSSPGEGGIAACYAALGDRDEFFNWIDRAISSKRIIPADLRYSPVYDKVRDDPRFPEIFRKLGLPY
jgi:TolB-like protein